MDEPQSNPSSVLLWFLAEMARKDVTVVRRAKAPTNPFGGYAYYEDTVPVRKYKKDVPLSLIRRASSATWRQSMPRLLTHNFLVGGCRDPWRSRSWDRLWYGRSARSDGVPKPRQRLGDAF